MKPAREVEFEVLGKDEPRPVSRGAMDDPMVALVARLMDTVFTVPGTKIRFGLDPILGLIPGLGDTAGAVVSALLIAQSARYGVPRVVLARMGLNVLMNTAVGAVPVVGDLFSVWFKSNARNYALLQKHAGTHRRASSKDWAIVIGILAALLALVVCIVVVAWTVLEKLFSGPAF